MSEDPRPHPPEKLLPGDCCGGGCVPCVLEAYEDALDQYHEHLVRWLARNPPPGRPGSPGKRVVLDTNVSLDLFVFDDPRWEGLRDALARGRCQAVIDAPCRAEFIRVLDYPQFSLGPRARVQAIERLDALFAFLDHDAHDEPPEAVALPACADPDDQKFLELALRSRAHALLSKDKALLKLNRRLRRLGLFEVLLPQSWLAARATEHEDPARGP